jgi:hypothetical protein
MAIIGIRKGAAALFGIALLAAELRAQQGGDAPQGGGDLIQQLHIELNPPTPERLFRLESEQDLKNRIYEELKDVRKVEFPPEEAAKPSSQLPPRIWPFLTSTVEPSYVCYKRLWFEQRNTERYGWDFGVLEPVIGTGIFYTDLAVLPLHWAANPFRCFDCSTGLCLPGDTVPLLWNPLLPK